MGVFEDAKKRTAPRSLAGVTPTGAKPIAEVQIEKAATAAGFPMLQVARPKGQRHDATGRGGPGSQLSVRILPKHNARFNELVRRFGLRKCDVIERAIDLVIDEIERERGGDANASTR